jgi:hypothetical protein
MKTKSILFGIVALMMSALMIGCGDDNPTRPAEAKTKIRVVHVSHDAPAVDIRVDDAVAITNLAYGQSSGYAELNAGTRNVKVTPAGSASPIVIQADLPLAENSDYSVYAVNNLDNIEPVFVEDLRTANTNMAKIRFLHASPDAPAVDIKLNNGSGTAVFSNVAFKTITPYAEVPAATYTFVVTPTGSTNEVVVFDPITVQNGMTYTVVAHGTLLNSDIFNFAVRVFVDNNEGNAYVDLTTATAKVMVVHASPDAPGVDLLVDNLVINAQALNHPDNTGYLDIAAGDRNIKVNASGTPTTVINANLNLIAENNYTIFAANRLSNISALVIEDNLTAPMAGKAHVRFVHLSPDAPAVDITLTDGTVIFGDKSFGEYTPFTPLNAGTYDLQVRLANDPTVVLNLPGITLQNGKIYTVFAKGFVGGTGGQALGAEIVVNN